MCDRNLNKINKQKQSTGKQSTQKSDKDIFKCTAKNQRMVASQLFAEKLRAISKTDKIQLFQPTW